MRRSAQVVHIGLEDYPDKRAGSVLKTVGPRNRLGSMPSVFRQISKDQRTPRSHPYRAVPNIVVRVVPAASPGFFRRVASRPVSPKVCGHDSGGNPNF